MPRSTSLNRVVSFLLLCDLNCRRGFPRCQIKINYCCSGAQAHGPRGFSPGRDLVGWLGCWFWAHFNLDEGWFFATCMCEYCTNHRELFVSPGITRILFLIVSPSPALTGVVKHGYSWESVFFEKDYLLWRFTDFSESRFCSTWHKEVVLMYDLSFNPHC